ncbi:MAG: carboxypeptidase-like regulatory domain-containing protein [Planctomycetota bacterium]
MISRPAAAQMSLLAAALLALTGCNSNGLVPVTGEVSLDGEPVVSAAVMFFPEGPGRPAWAHTDASGAFELTTYRDKDGAALGSYKVSVTKVVEEMVKAPKKPLDSAAAEIKAELQGRRRKREIWLVPQRYADASASGLVFAVESRGKNHAVFELASGAE